MRLSTRIKQAIESSEVSLVEIERWRDMALAMEQEKDDHPRSTKSHPSTSDWDGTIEGLMKKQRYVYQVFENANEPMDAVAFEKKYEHWVRRGMVAAQAPSGLRGRTAELVDLAVLEVVDKLGTSPTGRKAQRIGIPK
jgi:hypothetical protein